MPQKDIPPAAVPAKVKATPLPNKYVVPLLVILLTEAICGTMLLPFVGLFVAHLTGGKVEEAGYSSGFLIGVFMLGQVASGKMWGNISDTYGRKFPLAAGLLAGSVIIVFFGMSPNIYVCYLLRFIHGFLNGNTLVAKSMIADITDKTNEAKGFALVSITWCLGSLFGPAIGGFLYDPAHNSKTAWMNISETSFLARNPAFLPSLIVGIYTFAAFLCCVFSLPETNRERKSLTTIPVIGQFLSCMDSKDGHVGSEQMPSTDVVIVNIHASDSPSSPMATDKATPAQAESTPDGTSLGTTAAPPIVRRRKLSYKQAFHIAPIRNVTLFYVLLGISDMCYGEVLPLWGVASKESGGLGVFSDGVAILTLSYSIPAVLANVGFSRMCDMIQSLPRFWRLAVALAIVATGLVPFGSEFARGGYYFVLALGIFRQVGTSWCYSLVHLLTARSAPPGCVGSVYGISQSCASMARCIVPFIATPLFAWSLRDGHVFPFNHYLLFFLALIPIIVTYFLAYSLQLLPSASDADDVFATEAVPIAPDADAAMGDRAGVRSGGAAAASEAADTDDDRLSTYLSMAGSFATNPIADTYLNFDEMEAVNAQERAQHGYGAVSNAPRHTAPVTDPIAALLSHQQEDTRVAHDVADEEVPHQHV